MIAVWHFLPGKSSPIPSNFSHLIILKQLNRILRTVNAIIAVGILTRQRAGVRIQAGTGDISLLQDVQNGSIGPGLISRGKAAGAWS